MRFDNIDFCQLVVIWFSVFKLQSFQLSMLVVCPLINASSFSTSFSNTSARLSWSPLSGFRDYVYQVTYICLSTQQNITGEWSRNTSTLISPVAPGDICKISISAYANESALRSECETRTSDWHTFQLPVGIPTQPPNDLAAENNPSNATEIILSWKLPAISFQGGVALQYKAILTRYPGQVNADPAISDSILYSYLTISTDENSFESRLAALTTRYTMVVLAPEANIVYDVCVQVVTAAGDGPCAETSIRSSSRG
jgi:hypothetical protein